MSQGSWFNKSGVFRCLVESGSSGFKYVLSVIGLGLIEFAGTLRPWKGSLFRFLLDIRRLNDHVWRSWVCMVVWMSRFFLDRKDIKNSIPASEEKPKPSDKCNVPLSSSSSLSFFVSSSSVCSSLSPLLSSISLVLFFIISFPPQIKICIHWIMSCLSHVLLIILSLFVSAGRRDSVWRASWRFSTCCWRPRLGFVSWSFRGRSTSVWRPWSSSTPVSVTDADGPQPSSNQSSRGCLMFLRHSDEIVPMIYCGYLTFNLELFRLHFLVGFFFIILLQNDDEASATWCIVHLDAGL